jgi:hypothetical protein
LARRLLLAAALIVLPSVANADFFVLDNQGDPNFNQLLGINDGRIIVGYFGANLAPDLTQTMAMFWFLKITQQKRGTGFVSKQAAKQGSRARRSCTEKSPWL